VENTRQHRVFALMAAWVDDSIGLLERARAHLGTGPAARPRGGESEQAGRIRPAGSSGAR
jgi:hypothetical protein